jgi:FPC/CPF motif-containing protein YcgG
MLIDDVDEEAAQLGIRQKISARDFPCVGAKSALSTGRLKVVACYRLTSGWDDMRIHQELMTWSAQYAADSSGLRSLAFAFDGPDDLDEIEFEQAMWERLQSLADKDAWLGQEYDRRVSPDPSDPHFSLSFGGTAYFIVGLHPNASRPARRFPQPTLVFNLHDQFEKLRADGRYDRMRETIMARDVALAGSPNPMLQRHGEGSAAAQYSGRAVNDGWRCPFSDRRASNG